MTEKLYESNPSELFPSRFLKANDIPDGDLVLTIQMITQEELGQDKDSKPVLYFTETEKGLVLNKTNCDAISKLYPGKIGNWVGKRVALYATEVSFAGKTTMGVRVRLRIPETKPVDETNNPTELKIEQQPDGPSNWPE